MVLYAKRSCTQDFTVDPLCAQGYSQNEGGSAARGVPPRVAATGREWEAADREHDDAAYGRDAAHRDHVNSRTPQPFRKYAPDKVS